MFGKNGVCFPMFLALLGCVNWFVTNLNHLGFISLFEFSIQKNEIVRKTDVCLSFFRNMCMFCSGLFYTAHLTILSETYHIHAF